MSTDAATVQTAVQPGEQLVAWGSLMLDGHRAGAIKRQCDWPTGLLWDFGSIDSPYNTVVVEYCNDGRHVDGEEAIPQ